MCRDQASDSSLHPSALQGQPGRAGKEGHLQRSNILWPQDMASSQPDRSHVREGRPRSVDTDVPLPCPLLSSRGFLWLQPARSQGTAGKYSHRKYWGFLVWLDGANRPQYAYVVWTIEWPTGSPRNKTMSERCPTTVTEAWDSQELCPSY